MLQLVDQVDPIAIEILGEILAEIPDPVRFLIGDPGDETTAPDPKPPKTVAPRKPQRMIFVEELGHEIPPRVWFSIQQLAYTGKSRWSDWTLHKLWPEQSAELITELVEGGVVYVHLLSLDEGGGYDVRLTAYGQTCFEAAVVFDRRMTARVADWKAQLRQRAA